MKKFLLIVGVAVMITGCGATSRSMVASPAVQPAPQIANYSISAPITLEHYTLDKNSSEPSSNMITPMHLFIQEK